MNAYELADELQKLDAKLHLIDLFKSAVMLRQQADRIAELEKGGCGNCHACLVGVMENGYPVTMQRMVVCSDCGNKRCPKASNHRHQCTGSNEPNQRGSIYATPQTKPLSDEEIEEIAKQHLAAYAQFIGAGEVCYEGEIEFARAIEERHGIK